MKLVVTIIGFCLISGCGNIKPNDTRQLTRVKCSGASSWDECWKQAEQLCLGGYDLANKEEDRSGLKREIDVACK